MSVPPGGKVRVPFEVSEEALAIVNNAGERVLYHGEHLLEVTGKGAGAPERQVLKVVV